MRKNGLKVGEYLSKVQKYVRKKPACGFVLAVIGRGKKKQTYVVSGSLVAGIEVFKMRDNRDLERLQAKVKKGGK